MVVFKNNFYGKWIKENLMFAKKIAITVMLFASSLPSVAQDFYWQSFKAL